MLCRIPYTYTVAGTLKGRRKIEPYVFGAWTEAEIGDVSSREAPVSMSWDEPAFGKAIRKVTRWHDGANWRRPDDYGREDMVFPAEGFARLRELETQAIATRGGREPSSIIGEATAQNLQDLRAFLYSRGQVGEINPDEVREMHYSGRREAEARAVEGARNLLFVDGELWVRGGEPCYVLYVPGVNGPAVKTPEIGVSSLPHPQWPSFSMNCFRADRLGDAIDYLRELSGCGDVAVAGEIDVLIPEAVQFDDEGEALVRCARETVSLRTEGLRHASTEAVFAWLALRDGIKAPEPDLDALATHLATARRTLAAYGKPAETIDKALRRWEMRPLPDARFSP